MQVLWTEGACTVREVLQGLGANKPLAYTTVMTVLGRLTEKGLVVKDSTERAYRYRPAKSPEEFWASISSRMVEQVMAEFGEVAIAQFVRHLRQLDPSRTRRLLQMVEQQPKE